MQGDKQENEDDQFELDSKGEVVLTPISYTPWPIEKGSSGVQLRINVGSLNDLTKQTFSFNISDHTAFLLEKCSFYISVGALSMPFQLC